MPAVFPTMLVVARTSTPVPQGALPGLIRAAFDAESVHLDRVSLAMLAVLSALETGRGASLTNNNFGFITAGPNYEGTVFRPAWFEESEAAGNPKLERLHEEMKAGRAPSAFRAYMTQEDGARDFARVLLANFPEVISAAKVSDAEGFRSALALKYSPDYRNPKATESIAKLMREFGLTPSVISTAGTGPTGLFMFALVLWLAWRHSKKGRARAVGA